MEIEMGSMNMWIGGVMGIGGEARKDGSFMQT